MPYTSAAAAVVWKGVVGMASEEGAAEAPDAVAWGSGLEFGMPPAGGLGCLGGNMDDVCVCVNVALSGQ